MSSNRPLDDLRKARETEYFQKKNKEALERIAANKAEEPRISPVSGEPMVQENLMGVVIDRCPSSGGIWLDAGELEQLFDAHSQSAQENEDNSGFLADFFKGLSGK